MKAIKEQPAIQELEGPKTYETNISRDGLRMWTRKEPTEGSKEYPIKFLSYTKGVVLSKEIKQNMK